MANSALHTHHNQVIALAALAQAVRLVQRLARHGEVDEGDLAVLTTSVLRIECDGVEDLYGGPDALRTGIDRLAAQLGGAGGQGFDPEQARYATMLMALESRFMADPNMIHAVRKDLLEIARLAEVRGNVLDEDVLSRISRLYQATLSTLEPRIMVSGEPVHLNQAGVTDRIRTLLFAGVRALVLWKHCGGARWKLLVSRNALLKTCEALRAR